MDRMTSKDPARKRCFNPEPDVAGLLAAWARENRNVIESRMINEALRQHLAGYRMKRAQRAARAEVAA